MGNSLRFNGNSCAHMVHSILRHRYPGVSHRSHFQYDPNKRDESALVEHVRLSLSLFSIRTTLLHTISWWTGRCKLPHDSSTRIGQGRGSCVCLSLPRTEFYLRTSVLCA